MNEDKINGSCSMNVKNKNVEKFWLEDLKGRDLLGDVYTDGR
jgi:hypothetical protein